MEEGWGTGLEGWLMTERWGDGWSVIQRDEGVFEKTLRHLSFKPYELSGSDSLNFITIEYRVSTILSNELLLQMHGAGGVAKWLQGNNREAICRERFVTDERQTGFHECSCELQPRSVVFHV